MSLLTLAAAKREIFDPKNATHLASLKQFVKTGNWGNVQFHAELPYVEVPMTVLMKYAAYTLKVVPETAAKRSTRIAASKAIPWTSVQSSLDA